MFAERTGPHSPVRLSGSVPPLADSFHQRPETGLDLRVGLYPGDTVVLTHGEETARAPAGQGGTGKTQIAVAFSHALWGARAVDALVWVPAASREAIVAGFAQAARTVGAADHALPADAAAGRFVGWLAHTRRPWALILDDLVSLADLQGLWPAGRAGQVVITTGLPEAAFRAGPRIAPVGGFSRREVLAYLSARLTAFPDQRAEAIDLGEDLDGLPLALAQAAAVMSLNRLSCREYRGRFGERREHMATVRVDGVSPAVLATWSLAAECEQARPELAQLGQALRGCTAALWAADGAAPHPAAGQHARPEPGGPYQGAQAPQSVLWKPEAHPVLLRNGLSLEADGLAGSAIAYWQAMLVTSTRLLGNEHANAVTARDRLAAAYESAGRSGEAVEAFSAALADRERTRGKEHPDTFAARGNLAHAYASAGKPAEAVALYEQVAADAGRHLGPTHPVTLAARSDLAGAYQAAARDKEALTAYQMLRAETERQLGARHQDTLATRENLAAALLASGRPRDAIAHYKRLAADTEAGAGHNHPDAIAARASLASAYRRGGKPKDAIALYQRVLADRERVAGPGHPDTITARANLAFAYRSAGQLREAIPAYERTLADRERVQGPDHADTRAARANLAAAYQQAGRLDDAIYHYEQALADSERMLRPGDAQTLTIRSSLAAAYFADGRLAEVIPLLQRTLADSERHLGPDHPLTRTVRDNLEAARRT